jgi:hypothetical protein
MNSTSANPNNKPDIIINDNEIGTCIFIDAAISGPYNRNTVHLECKNKGGTSNNRGNQNQCKINHKIPEQHIVNLKK